MSTLEITDWSNRKVAWINSLDRAEAINALMQHKADSLGISPHKGYVGSDISFLKELGERLTGLVLPYAGSYDLKIIDQLPNLQFLVLGDTSQQYDFRRLKFMEDLSVEWRQVNCLPENSTPLKRLYIQGYKDKNGDLREVPAYFQLESLELVQGNLVSLTGVERFSSLKKGEFSYLTKLESIKGLAKTPVEILTFDSCKKAAEDLPSLAKCSNLKILGFHGGGDLESLKFLNFFKNLEEFRFVRTRIKDGDMTPLLKLKRVRFLKQRGYSHTPEQILEMIGQPPFVWDRSKKQIE